MADCEWRALPLVGSIGGGSPGAVAKYIRPAVCTAAPWQHCPALLVEIKEKIYVKYVVQIIDEIQ